jgi:hypothetical protein
LELLEQSSLSGWKRLEQLERSVAVEPLDKLRASYSKTSGRRAKTVDHRRKNSKNPTSTKNLRRERSGKSAWHVDAVACLSGGNKSLRLGARSPLPRTIEYDCDDHFLYGEAHGRLIVALQDLTVAPTISTLELFPKCRYQSAY